MENYVAGPKAEKTRGGIWGERVINCQMVKIKTLQEFTKSSDHLMLQC